MNTRSASSGGHPLECDGSGWSCNGFMEEDCVFDRVRQHLGRVHHVLVSEIHCANTTSRMYSPRVLHAEACRDTHASSSWGFLEYLRCESASVSGWLCKSVCGCLSLYCYDGTEVFEEDCGCMWDVPEDRFIAQRLLFLLTWMVHLWRFSYSFRDQLCLKCFSCKDCKYLIQIIIDSIIIIVFILIKMFANKSFFDTLI